MIIGLGHKAGVGKSTVAEIISKNFGFKRFSFSPLIQEEIKEGYQKYGYVYQVIYPNLFIINNETFQLSYTQFDQIVRATVKLQQNHPSAVQRIGTSVLYVTYVEDKTLLQIWGTDYRRKQNPNYWIEKFEAIYDPQENYVIENIRFLNEAEMVKKYGGIVAKVVLLDSEGNEINLNQDSRLPDHPSETELESYNFDVVFYNYYNDLERTEKEVVETILGFLEQNDSSKTTYTEGAGTED